MRDGYDTAYDEAAEKILADDADGRARQERIVLKSILILWSDAWEWVERFGGQVSDGAFRSGANRAVWKAMRAARAAGVSGHTADLAHHLVADEGVKAKFKDPTWGDHEAGFYAFMRGLLAEDLPLLTKPSDVALWLEGMQRAHLRERVRSLARGVASGTSPAEDLQRALDALYEPEGARGGPSVVGMAPGLTEALKGWDEDARSGLDPSNPGLAIPWGIFPAFDKGGATIRPTDYAVLAARPGRGKSTAAAQVAFNAAARTKKPVVYVSLEMPARQVYQRILCGVADVDDPGGKPFGPEQRDALERARDYLVREVPLLVVDTPPSNLWRLKPYLTSIVKDEQAVLTVIDYLGLIQAKGDEYQRVTLISQHLRAWAMGNTPVLMVHQLSRANVTEGSRPRTPRLTDLRGSGQIEQDATHVVFLHEKGDGSPGYDYEKDSRSVVEMVALLPKARQGIPGRAQEMRFHRPRSRMLPHAY